MIYKGEPVGVISLDNQKPFDWGMHKRLRKVSNPGIKKKKFPSSIKKVMKKWELELQFPKWKKIKKLASVNIYYIQCTLEDFL